MLDDIMHYVSGILLGTMLVVVITLFIWVLASIGVGLRTDAKCMHYGWRGGSVTWNLKSYCVKRIEQTDSIIPLYVLEGK